MKIADMDTCYYVGDSENLVKVDHSPLSDLPPGHPSPASFLRSYVPAPDSPIFRLRSRRKEQLSQKSTGSPVLLRRTNLKDGNPPAKRPSTWTEDITPNRPNKKYTRSRSDNVNGRQPLNPTAPVRKQKSVHNFDFVVSPVVPENDILSSNSTIPNGKSHKDQLTSPCFPYRQSVLDRLRGSESQMGIHRSQSVEVALLELKSTASTPDLVNVHSSMNLSRWHLASENGSDSPSPIFRGRLRSRSSSERSCSLISYNMSTLLQSKSDTFSSWCKKLRAALPLNFISIGNELWTEAIDKDPFSTFTFTEHQLERIIQNLEKKLSGVNLHSEGLHDFVLTDYDSSILREENGNYENISYHYAMELYCNIYQG